jgi:hypothetical protein
LKQIDKNFDSEAGIDEPRAALAADETALKQFLSRRNHFGDIVQTS